MQNAKKLDFATRAIHAGQDPKKWPSRALVPPIVHATTFNTDDFVGEHCDVSITRRYHYYFCNY